MRKSKTPLIIFSSAAIAALIWFSAVSRPALAQSDRKVTAAMVDKWMTELSNWGRWGKEDQMGAVNLITPAKRKQAAALVKDGVSVSLARNTETEKAADNDSPFVHTMTSTGKNPLEGFYSMDLISVSYHGWAHTHMDSLCHMFYKGKMFNGFSQEEVTTKGAQKLAITNFKNGILTRGILMDIPRLKGVPYLAAGDADLSGGSRGVGEEGGDQSRQRRCRSDPHRPMGDEGFERPLGYFVQLGGTLCFLRAMAEIPRCGDIG